MKKVCTKCKKEKINTQFAIDKRAISGLQSSCKECQSDFRKKRYYEDLNYRKKLLKRGLRYKKNNREKVYKTRKNYLSNNKEKTNITRKTYYINNKKTLNKKARKYQKNRRKIDILYKLKGDMRNLIGLSFRKKGFTKQSKTAKILGCSFEEFKTHIESHWKIWMNWDNHGKYNGEYNFGWDLDHIEALETAETVEDIIRLNHYTNFQPLCSKINRHIKPFL